MKLKISVPSTDLEFSQILDSSELIDTIQTDGTKLYDFSDSSEGGYTLYFFEGKLYRVVYSMCRSGKDLFVYPPENKESENV